MTLNYDDAWSDDCLQPTELAATQEIDRLFDRQTEQNRMSVVYSLSINKIRNNLIWLRIQMKANIFRSIFATVSSTVIFCSIFLHLKVSLSIMNR